MNTQPEWALNAAAEFLNEYSDGDLSTQDALASIFARHAPEPNERLVRAAKELIHPGKSQSCGNGVLVDWQLFRNLQVALSETQTEKEAV